jgi:hypothetical protein
MTLKKQNDNHNQQHYERSQHGHETKRNQRELTGIPRS